jgi:hypothetical protein
MPSPGQVSTFPCFISVEEEIPEIDRSMALRTWQLRISMHLLLGASESKYSIRQRRRWVQPVLDAFDKAIRLNELDGEHAPLQNAEIVGVDFGDERGMIELNNIEYVGATFVLVVDLSGAFTFDA